MAPVSVSNSWTWLAVSMADGSLVVVASSLLSTVLSVGLIKEGGNMFKNGGKNCSSGFHGMTGLGQVRRATGT